MVVGSLSGRRALAALLFVVGSGMIWRPKLHHAIAPQAAFVKLAPGGMPDMGRRRDATAGVPDGLAAGGRKTAIARWRPRYRSVNGTPPLAFESFGDSTICTVTASTDTPKFFTIASVMSFISPFFCSAVRPSTQNTMISGISFLLVGRPAHIKQDGPFPPIFFAPAQALFALAQSG
jgi:hypothetical protein